MDNNISHFLVPCGVFSVTASSELKGVAALCYGDIPPRGCRGYAGSGFSAVAVFKDNSIHRELLDLPCQNRVKPLGSITTCSDQHKFKRFSIACYATSI